MEFVTILIYSLLGLIGFWYIFGKPKNKNYPPGPLGFPVLGHFPLVGWNPHKKFMKWSKIYGPIFSIQFGSFPTIVLNDAKLIRAAFNDPNFSGRPPFSSMKARSGGIAEGVLFTEGQKWMDQRRFIIRNLKDFGFGKKSMEGIIQEEIKELIESFRKSVGKPQSTQNKFNAAVVNALWSLVVGERLKHDDPEFVTAIKHLASFTEANEVAGSLSNFFPLLAKYAPKLSGFEKLVKDTFPITEFLRKPIQKHKSTFQSGQHRDLIDMFLEEISKTSDPSSSFYKENGNQSMLFSIFDLFLAGAETTSTTLTWTFLYMAKFPEVQHTMQAEIQTIVGNSRLPSLSDRPNMPYTEAVIHEILRYSSLIPLGLMHNSFAEAELGGYTIPANTMIMANQYGVHFDESVWGDPNVFRPERFLNEDGQFVRHDSFIPFSVGKRVCLGETLARDELFLFITSLFQTFCVSPCIPIEDLSIEPNFGFVVTPLPHELILTECK